jgi:hypothetical protein
VTGAGVGKADVGAVSIEQLADRRHLIAVEPEIVSRSRPAVRRGKLGETRKTQVKLLELNQTPPPAHLSSEGMNGRERRHNDDACDCEIADGTIHRSSVPDLPDLANRSGSESPLFPVRIRYGARPLNKTEPPARRDELVQVSRWW